MKLLPPPPQTTPETGPTPRTRRPRLGGAGAVGAVLLALVALVAVCAPLLAPHDPLAQDLAHTNAAPGEHGYLLGTDQLGRDLLSRLLYGARTPLLVGVVAVVCGGAFGTLLGLVSGFARGWADQVLSRLADIQLALPSVLLALLVLTFGGQSTAVLVLVIALTGWPAYFRLVRSRVLSLRTMPYVEASLTQGVPTWRVLLYDLLPGVRGLVAVTATLDLSRAVLMEAGLTYLGLGAQAPAADWGLMVAEGQGQLLGAWWVAVLPGLCLVALVIGANLLGERLAGRRPGRRPVRTVKNTATANRAKRSTTA
ncbi:dipeptide/oligopeptide/nickel permease [Streptomyces bingchenggensis BCW-1]|uniref:Dipeptide/oligopeptide/nickel permease n=1 Tax=Streptomyces bingchenggensis (strain BCW-1) TaxID=749414 RepID=D7BY29_STRBB|nr:MULTISPECIES: ABC transporter permease [Streptomyces]ADI11909.1 dipeptide/oligopeptide/nickel permease [Streptomyces bingchenggensis BCW-1]